MTLKELQEQIENTMGRKVPTAAYLRGCQCPIAASRVMEDGGRLAVYANGFALYETGDGSTVFRADHCGGYIYFGRTGETSLTEEMFGGLEWWVRLVMEGEDRLTHNRNARIMRNETSYDGGDGFLLDRQSAPSPQEGYLRKETIAEAMGMMTVRQREGILFAQDVFDGFSDEVIGLIRAEAAPVEVMPDPSVSVEDMERYGYAFIGMVPMGAETAAEYFKQGNIMLYALHPDGTESAIGNEKQFQRHAQIGGLFAVDKQDWMKYLENGEYLRAAEVTEEQNYNMIDGRNNNRVEKKPEKDDSGKPSLLGRLKEKQELLSKGSQKGAPPQSKTKEMDMP